MGAPKRQRAWGDQHLALDRTKSGILKGFEHAILRDLFPRVWPLQALQGEDALTDILPRAALRSALG